MSDETDGAPPSELEMLLGPPTDHALSVEVLTTIEAVATADPGCGAPVGTVIESVIATTGYSVGSVSLAVSTLEAAGSITATLPGRVRLVDGTAVRLRSTADTEGW